MQKWTISGLNCQMKIDDATHRRTWALLMKLPQRLALWLLHMWKMWNVSDKPREKERKKRRKDKRGKETRKNCEYIRWVLDFKDYCNRKIVTNFIPRTLARCSHHDTVYVMSLLSPYSTCHHLTSEYRLVMATRYSLHDTVYVIELVFIYINLTLDI